MTPDWPRADATPVEPLPTRVAGLLLDHLLTGRVPPGTRLPSERQLAETLGVGRSVVREALKSLGLLGLVEVRQGDGTYLRRVESEFLPRVIEWGLLLGERRIADLIEARQHLEAVTAGLAAQRRTEADLAALTACLKGMREADADVDEFAAQDVSFHLAVAAAAGNAVLCDVLRGIQSLLRVWITRVVLAAGDCAPSYREHLPVYEAIAAGDPELATAAMRAHLAAAAQRLGAALDSDRPSSGTGFTPAADPRE